MPLPGAPHGQQYRGQGGRHQPAEHLDEAARHAVGPVVVPPAF